MWVKKGTWIWYVGKVGWKVTKQVWGILTSDSIVLTSNRMAGMIQDKCKLSKIGMFRSWGMCICTSYMKTLLLNFKTLKSFDRWRRRMSRCYLDMFISNMKRNVRLIMFCVLWLLVNPNKIPTERKPYRSKGIKSKVAERMCARELRYCFGESWRLVKEREGGIEIQIEITW